mgnify:CR=1 FL=1
MPLAVTFMIEQLALLSWTAQDSGHVARQPGLVRARRGGPWGGEVARLMRMIGVSLEVESVHRVEQVLRAIPGGGAV